MKIALINSEYPSHLKTGHGGIATYTYLMANALALQGHSVSVLVREGTVVDQLHNSIRLYKFSHIPVSRPRRLLERLTGRSGECKWERAQSRHIAGILRSIHKNEGLDIAEFPEYGGLANQVKSSSFAIVINFHTPLEIVDRLNNVTPSKLRRQMYNFERKALKNASGFRCPSRALKEMVCKEYAIPENSVAMIRNPVFIEPFDLIEKICFFQGGWNTGKARNCSPGALNES